MSVDLPQATPIGSAAAKVIEKLAEKTGYEIRDDRPMVATQEIQRMGQTSTPPPISESAAVLTMIERAARDPSINIDRMEQLFAMRERMEAAHAKRAFASAMADMQPELPVVDQNGRINIAKKDKPGEVLQSTPYALWADINEGISPVLAAHGFALSFRTGQTAEGKITVTAFLSHREGHEIETTIMLAHDSTGSKNSVQAVGSSISYGKRYTAGLLLNFTSRHVADADDDGRKAGAGGALDDEQSERIRALALEVRADVPKFLDFFKSESIPDIRAADYQRAVMMLEAKRKKMMEGVG